MANSKVLWGIAGLGNIAHRFVKDLVAQVTEAELYAVAARDIQRAKIFAKQYQCQTYFGSYIELATDPNVDVVYVATIHPFHKHLVELFLNHGKHVLVEKPAFTNLKDWDEMANLAKRKGLILAEAMKTVAFPAYRSMKQFITDNNIVISNIEASFGTEHDFDPAWHLFNPRLAGGATLDVGVYGLWLYADLCYLLQASIATPEIAIVKDNDRSEVDENIDFAFKGQVTGRIGASITRNLKREAIITGLMLKLLFMINGGTRKLSILISEVSIQD